MQPEQARRLRMRQLRLGQAAPTRISFEFCENGAKATAWEITAKRATPDFFAHHTLAELEAWTDLELETRAG